MTAYCFVDTETTSLNRHTRVAWEIALCRREDGKEKRIEFQIELTNREINQADQESLDIGGFDERYNDVSAFSRRSAAALIREYTAGTVLVGRQIQFDADNLLDILESVEGQLDTPPWSHKMLDIGTLVKGYLFGVNRDVVLDEEGEYDHLVGHEIYKTLDVNEEDFAMHSAMGDVEYDMAVFDALMDQ